MKSASNRLSLSLVLALAALAGSASAATGTATFDVTASVPATCTITTNALAFAPYNPSGASAVDANGAVNVLCTNGTSFWIGLDNGLGTGATAASRKMRDTVLGSALLSYSLYTDSARTITWDGSQVASNSGSGLGMGTPVALTVYGRIPSGQSNVTASTAYLDTITSTITY